METKTNILHITEDNFKEEVKNSKNPIIIDFWAEWCGPCRMMGPVFEQLSKEITSVKFAKVNVDEEPKIAEEFEVQGIPTLIIVKNGKELSRIVGFMPKETLGAKINNIITNV